MSKPISVEEMLSECQNKKVFQVTRGVLQKLLMVQMTDTCGNRLLVHSKDYPTQLKGQLIAPIQGERKKRGVIETDSNLQISKTITLEVKDKEQPARMANDSFDRVNFPINAEWGTIRRTGNGSENWGLILNRNTVLHEGWNEVFVSYGEKYWREAFARDAEKQEFEKPLRYQAYNCYVKEGEINTPAIRAEWYKVL